MVRPAPMRGQLDLFREIEHDVKEMEKAATQQRNLATTVDPDRNAAHFLVCEWRVLGDHTRRYWMASLSNIAWGVILDPLELLASHWNEVQRRHRPGRDQTWWVESRPWQKAGT